MIVLSLSDVVFIMLINVKMQTIIGILAFMSRINFVLSWVAHKKSFKTLGPEQTKSFSNQIHQNKTLHFLNQIDEYTI